ncbi:carbohydrate-binding protein [Paenibacillus alkalitolerans]|uniref:carbohydrate-binding protein n=1 Tax=Paenibacillus alkalitolerans TaxID=2799335 RepID=UPI0018F2B6DB|nr:carbohydrate-binding protein [Paenibacillus alkalitolerans]
MKKSFKFSRRGILTFLLAAFIVTSVFVFIGKVGEEGALLKTGNYIYNRAPDGGNPPDWEETGVISSTNGVLFDGAPSYAGWMGSATSPGTVNVVIDLLKDYPLDQIRVVLNSPNKYWGFKDITIKYRPESASGYYIAERHVRTGTDLNYSVTVPMSNKSARMIILNIRRTQPYQHIPLTEVEIYRGSGDEGQNPGPALTPEQLKAELKKEALLADKYGQSVSETWPGKVTSDAQLQQEYADEAAALANVSLDLSKYDQYGGIKSLGKHASTGYFRLQNINGKWWFITPEGYPFIVKGVDAASLWEYGYKTPILKADGTTKQIFEELPDRTAFAPGYTRDAKGEYVSFVVANVMKKYGSGYESKWEDITKKRLIHWGFNTFSKWTKPKNIAFPYIQVLQDPSNLRRIKWTYDVFDPQSRPNIEKSLKTKLQNARHSKWLIGYTYDNEAGWNAEIVKQVLTYSSDSPAKSAFVDFLAPRYNGNLAVVNRILGTHAVTFDALKDTPIDIAKVPAVDISEYIRLASRTYHSMIRDIIKKYDPNHLFLGTTVVPTWRTSLGWDQEAMGYVDAFSVDSYTRNASWISRYEAYGKPLLNLEHSFGLTERGLSDISTATMTPSIAEKGRAYQALAESQAAHPLFVGSGWFSYYDQPVTGRPDGESYNVGLVNQQDQPYTDMVNIMKKAHDGLENLHRNGGGNLSLQVPSPVKIEAEKYSSQMGIATYTLSETETGLRVGSLQPGDWVAYSDVSLTGMRSIDFRFASAGSGTMRIRLGSPTGTIIGTFNITTTGGWQNWNTSNVPIAPTVGTQNLYFTFEGVEGQAIGTIDYFEIKHQ